MAKQTFTTGQVLTAAQMTSLQETAMGGGPATAKTANYVLVAADAGTTVAMNAAGSTTITVNSGLFAAGDTVFIQNLGAGNCTVTAGTATVATAGSLILPQNDAGILYFTSASAAIFYDYIQVGATSPLTTKGDIYVYGTSDTRLPVGANGTTLVADSTQTTGLKWAAAASGKVLQVVFARTNTGATSTSNTYADTNLTATITPTLATSKVLVLVSQNGIYKQNFNNAVDLTLLRDSTEINFFADRLAYNNDSTVRNVVSGSCSYLDSPATTSATTYKTQFRVDGTTTTAVYCQQGNEYSTITLMEIGV